MNTATIEKERMFQVTRGDEVHQLVTRGDIIIGARDEMERFMGKNIDRVINRLWYERYHVQEVGQ